MLESFTLTPVDVGAVSGGFVTIIVAQWAWLRAKFEDLKEDVAAMREQQSNWLSIREYEARQTTNGLAIQQLWEQNEKLWAVLREIKADDN